VVLDEPTSALSAEAAVQLYAAVQAAGVTCVSVGQDCEALRSVHNMLLHVGLPGGGWQLGKC
jgi:ABC-type uncharacterized transport system fused permease/ATPase subunit